MDVVSLLPPTVKPNYLGYWCCHLVLARSFGASSDRCPVPAHITTCPITRRTQPSIMMFLPVFILDSSHVVRLFHSIVYIWRLICWCVSGLAVRVHTSRRKCHLCVTGHLTVLHENVRVDLGEAFEGEVVTDCCDPFASRSGLCARSVTHSETLHSSVAAI